jgi:hypothetical protein
MLGRFGDYEKAESELEKSQQHLASNPHGYMYCASSYSVLCTNLVNDLNITGERRSALIAKYAGLAMKMLAKAESRDYFKLPANVASLQDSDLDPLRDRTDFKDLVDRYRPEEPKKQLQ